MKALYCKILESKLFLEINKVYDYDYLFLDPKFNNGKIGEYEIFVYCWGISAFPQGIYSFTKEQFDNHFITLKQLRKLKLHNINENNESNL